MGGKVKIFLAEVARDPGVGTLGVEIAGLLGCLFHPWGPVRIGIPQFARHARHRNDQNAALMDSAYLQHTISLRPFLSINDRRDYPLRLPNGSWVLFLDSP
jgi:hypothetical protein